MSGFNLTEGQKQAVTLRGSALLVSAAAGSGKTRVLVERLISRITDAQSPSDITDFLIITYTRAAAAELKSRVSEALGEAAASAPQNKRLRRQASLCARAQIGTIHSFCTSLLRENCHLAGLTPDFRVLPEDRADAMKRSALTRVLERAYEEIDGDVSFRLLVDSVGAGRDDARLEQVVMTLHTKMQSHADPAAWAAAQRAQLETASSLDDAGQTIWGAYLLSRAVRTAEYWSAQLDGLTELLYADTDANAPIIKAYGESLAVTADGVRELARSAALGWDAAAAVKVLFPAFKPLRGFDNQALKEAVTGRRAACKKAMEALSRDFSSDSRRLLDDMDTVRPAMSGLLGLCLDFDREYAAAKRRQSLVDFADLEHKALSLLRGQDGQPTELAREVSQRYAEIMVDEYQDVNAVQDAIFTAVSREGRNLFMVGDVKQSIYRFRLADPGIFIAKYLSYSEPDKAEDGQPRKVLLQENFRSRASVLQAANHVFSNLMSSELGELDYDEGSALRPAADYPDGGLPVELSIVRVPDSLPEEDSPNKSALEAAYVASRIRGLVESGAAVWENGAQRPLDYGDIVILLRSPGPAGPVYRRALAEAGVPAEAEQGGAFFSSPEISLALSLLAVIDNPRQDVPLISVLRSPLFGFNADELALIRAAAPDADFYTALMTHAEEDGKCRDFLERLNGLRAAAPDLQTDRLLRLIYDALDFPALCSAMEYGPVRRENLEALADYAARFESEGYRGLFRFVAWLKRLMERGEEPRVGVPGTARAVRIMSIHRSKGLEFPVVFLADTGRLFNRQDLQAPVLVHWELGLGPNVTDTARRLEYPSLCRRAVEARLKNELLSEELRVLYVAMTRARERLFITCASRRPEERLEKLREGLCSPLPPQVAETARCPADWLLRAALLDDGSRLCLSIAEPDAAGESTAVSPETQVGSAPADPDRAEELRRRLDWRYPLPHSDLPSKLTATELKDAARGSDRDAESAELAPPRDFAFELPELGKARLHSGTERGTAVHRALQYIDLSKALLPGGIESELLRLRDSGRLDAEQYAAADVSTLTSFFASGVGRRLLDAKNVSREFRFSLLCPASDYFPEGGDDDLLLQGIVDCFFEEEDGLVLLDYKTDRISISAIPERAKAYRPQLTAYAAALRRITGRCVKQAYLYFLTPGVEWRLPGFTSFFQK